MKPCLKFVLFEGRGDTDYTENYFYFQFGFKGEFKLKMKF